MCAGLCFSIKEKKKKKLTKIKSAASPSPMSIQYVSDNNSHCWSTVVSANIPGEVFVYYR